MSEIVLTAIPRKLEQFRTYDDGRFVDRKRKLENSFERYALLFISHTLYKVL